MAAVAPVADQASNLLQKLSLDSQARDANEGTKKPANAEVPNTPSPSERSVTPYPLPDPSMFYVPNGYTPQTYYYGAYDGSVREWNDYSRYANIEGVQMPPGVNGDIYHSAYGYDQYNACPPNGSPVPAMGHDGQLCGPQTYQYRTSFFQPPTPTSTLQTASLPPTSEGEISTSFPADQPLVSVDTAKSNSNAVDNRNANGKLGQATVRASHQNPSLTSNASYRRGSLPGGPHSTCYQGPQFGYDGTRSPVPWFDRPVYSNGQHRPATSSSQSSTLTHNASSTPARNQNQHPLPHFMGMHGPRSTSGSRPATPDFLNRMYPYNQLYGQYGNAFRNGLGFGYNYYDPRTNGQWGLVSVNKYKPKYRGNGFHGHGNENHDSFTELNRGPRAGRFQNPKALGSTVTIAARGQNLALIGNQNSSTTHDKEHYNHEDFLDKYEDAKFFIIKSYSEDDIHKSIKYNVWASTPSGNKKLDAAYQEAHEKSSGCPVFLFFSVNASGQFVGVAEMVGPVDFNKTVEYWQQDKWIGCFPVKWHIVKDVPNNLLKHITLENNENRPVTNSRDTQEVKLEQGLQMLKIFKEHVSKTSILDDFGFYENRQKLMQEKRSKQQHQKQVCVGNSSDAIVSEKEKDAANANTLLQKPFKSVSILKKGPTQVGIAEPDQPQDNGVAAVAGVSIGVAQPAVEKCAGLVNGH